IAGPRRRGCTPPPKTIASPLNGGISIPRTPRRVLKLLQRGHAPGAETSSGLALLSSNTDRRGGRAAARRRRCVLLFRDRQDRRSAHTADHVGHARRRTLAAHLLRGVRPDFGEQRVLRIQLCALDPMGGL